MISQLFKTSLLAFIILYFCLATVLLQKNIPLGHDTYAHLTYGKLFIQTINEGQFPVRWTEGIRNGLSQPLFNYYQVGFYYYLYLINIFVPSLTLTTQISILFLWGFSSLFVYLLTYKYGKLSALLATIVYTFSPYLILDIFVRSSFPEFMAISLMPAILWSIDSLITQKKPIIYAFFLSILLALAIISHLPTVVIFFVVILGFFFLSYWYYGKQLPRLILFIFSGVIALGLSSFYLLPAIGELSYIQINKLTSGNFDYRLNFTENSLFSYIWGYGQPGNNQQLQSLVILGLSPWVLVLSSSLIFNKINQFSKVQVIFWLISLIYILFFMHQISEVVWAKLSILRFIQFPWRFFMIVPIASATLTAIFIQSLRTIQAIRGVTILIIIFSSLMLVTLVINAKYINANDFNLPKSDWLNSLLVRKEAYFEPGYLPKGASYDINNQLSKWTVASDVSVKEIVNLGYEKSFIINSTRKNSFILNTPYFLGWKAYINSQEVDINSKNNGLMEINLPQGQSDIVFRFEDTPIRRLSNILFGVSLTLLLIMILINSNLLKKY